MYLPIAHAEGKFVGLDGATLDRLEQNGQFVLRYAADDNPNGSERDVAGMCDATGRVFGLMPHPERFVDRTQHPHWTRLPEFAEGDGLQLFRNAVRYFS
jgi:phosphoribosylformylglycinamidine synthase